jgi:nucleoside-diphosphate-sugar epimerase
LDLEMKDVIVITGGGGFCGIHLAEHLVSRFRIRLFDTFVRNSLQFAPHLTQSSEIEIISGDVLDGRAVRAVIKGAYAIIHCAAIAGVSNYYNRPVDTLRVNIIGTFNTLDAAVDARVRRFIHFSSSEIYGPSANSVAETAAPTSGPVSDRRWVYSVSKLSGEHATLRYGEAYGINTTTVRPFNVYGPLQTGEGAISNFARRLIRGEPIEVYGDGSDIRAWCHVRDLVMAVDLMLDNEAAFGTTFNVGNPAARLTTLDLAHMMVALHGSGEVRQVPQTHSPIRVRTPDIARANALLGFVPKIGLPEGLKNTLDWFEKVRP